MITNSSNMVAATTSQDIPTIIKKGKLSVTTSNFLSIGPPSSGYYLNGTDGVLNLKDLRIDANMQIDAWLKPSGQNVLYKFPVITMNSSTGKEDINAFIVQGADSSGDYNQVTFLVRRFQNYGSYTDAYTVYYIIYSTRVFDVPILAS